MLLTPGMGRAWYQMRACKPVELNEEDENKSGLKRCLTKVDLIAYGIGSCVGAGVFVTTGEIAAFYSGGAVSISFLIAGIAAALSGLCYGEFAARLPIAGSAYTYAYASLGEFMAWIMGWNLCLEYGVAAGTIAVGWSSYFIAIFANFDIVLPLGLTPVKLGDTLFQINPLGLFIVIFVTIIQLFGCKLSIKFNLFITVWNISLITFVIIYGFTFVDADNWDPFMPFGFGEVLAGAGVAFFSYIGFDCVSSLAAEAVKPQIDIPIGLMGTLGVASTLYCLLGLVIAGMVPYLTLQDEAYVNSPISQAFEFVGSDWAAKLIAFGSVTTLTATTLCAMLGQPRVLLAMAQDGLMPTAFGRVNRRNVPVAGTIFTAFVSGSLAFLFTFNFLADTISLGTFMAFSFVCSGVLILRLAYNPKKVDPSTQPGKRVVPAWMSKVAVTWFGLGSWVFSMIARRSGAGPAIYVPCLVIFSIAPLIFILYNWYYCVLCPSAPTFQTPLMPYTPLAGLFVNGVLMAGLDGQSYLNLVIWTVAGILFYFFYGFKKSVLRHERESKVLEAVTHGEQTIGELPLDSTDDKMKN